MIDSGRPNGGREFGFALFGRAPSGVARSRPAAQGWWPAFLSALIGRAPIANDLASAGPDPRQGGDASPAVGQLPSIASGETLRIRPGELAASAQLTSLAEESSRLSDLGRRALQQPRGSRSLAAWLPLSNEDRRAMVAGWFVGQIIGAVDIPDAPFRTPVRVWEPGFGGIGPGQWTDFPHPLLTPPRQFAVAFDWLPAILESLLLAVARAHEPPVASSLRPYQALLSLYDSELPVTDRLREWIHGGTSMSGAHTRVPGAGVAADPKERITLAIAWLRRIGGISMLYLAGDPRIGATDQVGAPGRPLFADLAVDVRDMTAEISRALERILDDAGPDDAGPVDEAAF